RLRIRPGELREHAGGNRSTLKHTGAEANVGLQAQPAVEVLACAPEQRDRHRREHVIPLEMRAPRCAAMDVAKVVGFEEIGLVRLTSRLVSQLRAGVQTGRKA